jgi:hypothetical protein
MQAVIAHPCCAADGLASEEARRFFVESDLPRLVKTRGALSAVDRLGIYQGMYLPRMHDALASDYPALKALIGDDAFTELVRAYVQEFPSRSYTLNRLGDHLPGFLEGWGAARGRRTRAALARLELAVTEVFDADETPAIAADTLAAVSPAIWPYARLEWIAALRVLELPRGTLELCRVLKEGRPAPQRGRGREHVLVLRTEDRVRTRELARAEGFLLSRLTAGAMLGAALQALASSRLAADPSEVGEWMRRWAGEGLLAGVRAPRKAEEKKG